jgi:hypothetical protein
MKNYTTIIFFGLLAFIFALFYMYTMQYWDNIGYYLDTIETQYKWGKSMSELGIINFWSGYLQFLDYQFGAVLLDFFAYKISTLFGGTELAFVNVMRSLNLIATGLIAYISYTNLVRNNSKLISLTYSLLIFILPVSLFTSITWGQTDMMIVLNTILFLIFASRYIQHEKVSKFSSTMLGVTTSALLFIKLQGVVIFPTVILILLTRSNWRAKIFKLFTDANFLIGFFISTLILFVFPLIINPYKTIENIIQPFIRGEVLSNGAHNFWNLVVSNPVSQSSYLGVFNLGFLVWIIIIAIFILLLKTLLKNKNLNINIMELSFIFASLYFYFASKMMSRYSILAIVLLYLVISFKNLKNSYLLLVALALMNISYFINQYTIFSFYYKGVLEYLDNWVFEILTLSNISIELQSTIFFLLGMLLVFYEFWRRNYKESKNLI